MPEEAGEQIVIDPAFESGKSIAEAWDEVRSDPDIQFEPIEIESQIAEPTPDWLKAVAEFFEAVFGPIIQFLAGNWAMIWPVLAAAGIAFILYMVWRIFGEAMLSKKSTAQAEEEEQQWVPQAEEAVALLKDADALAAEGRYDEATHLLLRRSVAQINGARPDLIEPSSTAREIAEFSALPDNARTAFSVIADRVERSLFALRRLDQGDWTAARAAYADFAKIGTNITPQALAA